MKTFASTPTTLHPLAVRPRLRCVVLLTAVATLVGCASCSPDGAFATVAQAAKDRLGKGVRWARTPADQDGIDQRVDELLAKPLSADDAVQVALLNNRGLQASFQELGVTEAEVVQAGRVPNPGFSFSRLKRGDEIELERGIHIKLARLAAMPMIGAMEARRFEATQRLVTMTMLSVAADTRKAWVAALAAEETVRHMRQVKQAAEASAELARRMEQVGNFNKQRQRGTHPARLGNRGRTAALRLGRRPRGARGRGLHAGGAPRG